MALADLDPYGCVLLVHLLHQLVGAPEIHEHSYTARYRVQRERHDVVEVEAERPWCNYARLIEELSHCIRVKHGQAESDGATLIQLRHLVRVSACSTALSAHLVEAARDNDLLRRVSLPALSVPSIEVVNAILIFHRISFDIVVCVLRSFISILFGSLRDCLGVLSGLLVIVYPTRLADVLELLLKQFHLVSLKELGASQLGCSYFLSALILLRLECGFTEEMFYSIGVALLEVFAALTGIKLLGSLMLLLGLHSTHIIFSI